MLLALGFALRFRIQDPDTVYGLLRLTTVRFVNTGNANTSDGLTSMHKQKPKKLTPTGMQFAPPYWPQGRIWHDYLSNHRLNRRRYVSNCNSDLRIFAQWSLNDDAVRSPGGIRDCRLNPLVYMTILGLISPPRYSGNSTIDGNLVIRSNRNVVVQM